MYLVWVSEHRARDERSDFLGPVTFHKSLVFSKCQNPGLRVRTRTGLTVLLPPRACNAGRQLPGG